MASIVFDKKWGLLDSRSDKPPGADRLSVAHSGVSCLQSLNVHSKNYNIVLLLRQDYGPHE